MSLSEEYEGILHQIWDIQVGLNLLEKEIVKWYERLATTEQDEDLIVENEKAIL